MTITIETISCVRDVWTALSEAAQEADTLGLISLQEVASKFDCLCDELIDQAGDERNASYELLINARKSGRDDYRLQDELRSEFLSQ